MATFEEALGKLDTAVNEVFSSDLRVQALGITGHGGDFSYRAIRNIARVIPLAASRPRVFSVSGVPVAYSDVTSDPIVHVKLPANGPGSPTAASVIPEQARSRPLVGGLQIQNWDDDDRQGHPKAGFIVIGSLGCFVTLDSGATAILSNNHVVAGENRGVQGDRIQQSGSSMFAVGDLVAELTTYVPLVTSPGGARPALGTVNFNLIDAGVAALGAGVGFVRSYLPSRAVPSPSGTAPPRVHDKVFKVGRTTGLTWGEIKDIHTVVGPVSYAPGDVWFKDSITIEGDNGTLFSDHGDSGSAILKAGTGEVVGLLYAGNGVQTYACPIASVFSLLNCSL